MSSFIKSSLLALFFAGLLSVGVYDAAWARPGGGRGGGFNQIPSSAQGTIKGFSTVDFAVKKDFLKNKAASVTASISDIFNTRQYELNQLSPGFAQDYIRKRESRIFKINFSYRFGKFDASLFKKKKRDQGGDMNMGDQMQQGF